MVGRIIQSLDCVAEGAAWLAAREDRFAEALALVGDLPLRRHDEMTGSVWSWRVSAVIEAQRGHSVIARGARA
jgi:DNA-3-methyladenine glycosylase II